MAKDKLRGNPKILEGLYQMKEDFEKNKGGHPRAYKTPEELLEKVIEYFEDTMSRVDWDLFDYVGKDAKEIIKKSIVPFSQDGLCSHLRISQQTWRNYRSEYQQKASEGDPDGVRFFEVITRADQTIRTQQIEGALLGYFSHNLAARLNGLIDKQEINQHTTLLQSAPMSKEEIQDISKGLEEEF